MKSVIKKYFLYFFFGIIYWELVIRVRISGAFAVHNTYFLVFVPAEALFFVAINGFFNKSKKRKLINGLIRSFFMIVLWLYYSIQLIYYMNFGSLFSVGFTGMGGEALGNFGWSLKPAIMKSLPCILLMLIPVIISFAGLKWEKNKRSGIKPKQRALIAVLTVITWFAAIGILRLFGNDRTSAYYAFTNNLVNTDVAADKLGALTTSVVESGMYFFGVGADNGESNLGAVNVSSLTSMGNPGVSSDAVSSNAGAEQENVIRYHINEAFDFEEIAASCENDICRDLCEYFGSKEPLAYNEYTGMFEGYNLIYICAESFSTQALNENVTPLLCQMADEGIVLNNYYNSYMNTTTNGEFAFSVSLWPDVSRYAADGNDVGSFARSSDKYMPYGLGNIFEEIGVPSFAYHGYISSYYRRCDSWPNLGYSTMKFMNEGMTFVNQWSPSDRELVEQSVTDYVNEDRFFTYYMTYSGHGSYLPTTYMYLKNSAEVLECLGDEEYNDAEIAYYCGNYELDKALENLMDELENAGQLDNTLFVIAGDHVPYNMTTEDLADLSARQGIEFDTEFEMYHSTCIIYSTSMTEPIESDAYCCNVDILPTVLNLLGIEYDSRLIMGNDILADDTLHRARLYNGSFITEYVKYNSSTGSVLWSPFAESFTDEEKEQYLAALIEYTESEYEASVNLLDNDFYRFLWEAAGIYQN